MPPKPKDLREQPTRKRLMSPVEVESVASENEDPKVSKGELQALIKGEQAKALEKLKSLGDKYKPTPIKPGQQVPARPQESALEQEETEGEEDNSSPVGEVDFMPQAAREGQEESSQESEEQQGRKEDSDQETGELEEREQEESGGQQPSASRTQPRNPKSVLDAISPSTTHMISRFLEEVQLHALEQADLLLKAGANLTLPQLIGTVKDLAELKVLLRWQAKLEKEIVKGRVPMVPPGAGRFPTLSKLSKISGQLKKAVGGETPEWAGEVPE